MWFNEDIVPLPFIATVLISSFCWNKLLAACVVELDSALYRSPYVLLRCYEF
jgi:hypothetical protein